MAELSFEQRQAKQAEVIRAYNRLFNTTMVNLSWKTLNRLIGLTVPRLTLTQTL